MNILMHTPSLTALTLNIFLGNTSCHLQNLSSNFGKMLGDVVSSLMP